MIGPNVHACQGVHIWNISNSQAEPPRYVNWSVPKASNNPGVRPCTNDLQVCVNKPPCHGALTSRLSERSLLLYPQDFSSWIYYMLWYWRYLSPSEKARWYQVWSWVGDLDSPVLIVCIKLFSSSCLSTRFLQVVPLLGRLRGWSLSQEFVMWSAQFWWSTINSSLFLANPKVFFAWIYYMIWHFLEGSGVKGYFRVRNLDIPLFWWSTTESSRLIAYPQDFSRWIYWMLWYRLEIFLFWDASEVEP